MDQSQAKRAVLFVYFSSQRSQPKLRPAKGLDTFEKSKALLKIVEINKFEVSKIKVKTQNLSVFH